MTEVEQVLYESLVALEQAVESMATAQPQMNLTEHLARVDALTGTLPPTTDPALLHYLQKKSYQKARLFLEAQD